MDPFEKRLRETLQDITYKDWVFRIEKDGIGLWFLQVLFAAENAQTGNPENWSGRKWRMSMHMGRSEIIQTALKAVLAAEEHEARENFKYQGRAIFGPHLNVDHLWHIAENTETRK